MVRVILGSIVAAVAMLVVGFLIHATPLNALGSGSVTNDRAGALQASLKANLPYTGTYNVPDADTAEQTALYGTGPIATIHFNAGGHAANDASMFLSGFILNFIVAFLIGLGLTGADFRANDFTSRARLVVPFAFAAAVFIHIGRPIYMHHDWNNAIFSMIADGMALAIGGLVVAWFLPRGDRHPGSQAC
jgi:hypothetical protein